MTALLTLLQSILSNKPRMVSLPNVPPESDRAYRSAKLKLGDIISIQTMTEQENQFWVTLARTTHLHNSWENLRSSEIKNIGLCLWYGDAPLADDEYFFKSFLQACETRMKKSLCRSLIWTYLHHYESNKPGIALLGRWLAKMVSEWAPQWAYRQRQFSLFNDREAPGAIANTLIESKESLAVVLESCGLAGTLQSGGMTSTAFAEAIRQYRDYSKFNDVEERFFRLKRVLEWATLNGKQFAYPKLKTILIESLLLPWAEGNPDEKTVNATQSFLVDHFGDPRLGGASWIGVDEAAMRIIRRWLVKRALAQFLDVVDELALDHQWKYRRAFWMAYYKKELISDAWVIFATKGAAKAREIALRCEDPSWRSFGNLKDYRVSDHAVLLLRIGDLTIADFSHNGKWRIWNKGNDKAPKPYNNNYRCDALMYGDADDEGSHTASDRYKWQRDLERIISKSIGRERISQEDYKV